MATPLFNRPGAVFVPVPDLAEARDWYVDTLGFTSCGHWPEWGVSDVVLPQSATALALTARAPGRTLGWLCEETSQPHVNLLVDDGKAVHASLVDLGVEVGSVQEFGNGCDFWLKDPFGNLFGVTQPDCGRTHAGVSATAIGRSHS